MDIEKFYEVIKTLFQKENESTDLQDIEIQFEPLAGLTNKIYRVKIYNKNTKTFLREIVYKVFGDNTEFIDRKLEEDIMNGLSDKGYGPKVLLSDRKTCRVEEYINGAKDLEITELMEEQLVHQVIRILVSYSMISSVYNYNIFSEKFETDYKIKINNTNDNSTTTVIKQNIYDMCTKTMLKKATKNFKIFSHKFKERVDKIIDKKLLSNFMKLEDYLKNYKKVFNDVIPKEGLLVLNHNDVHRLNFLAIDKSKLMLIDHEYAALNLIGIDILNYMIESNFNYKENSFPFFSFSEDKLDYEKMFDVYHQYLDQYQNLIKETQLIDKKKQYELLNQYRSRDHFLRLVCLISLLWFIYSIINLDFESFSAKSTFDQFLHAIKRLEIFEKTYRMINTEISI